MMPKIRRKSKMLIGKTRIILREHSITLVFLILRGYGIYFAYYTK